MPKPDIPSLGIFIGFLVYDFNVQFTTLITENKSQKLPKNSLDCHRFGQITGLIDVGAAGQGGVVGEQLQRDHVQDGGELAVVFWHADDVDAFA